MENRIFPENYGNENAPEVVHYKPETQRESGEEAKQPVENPPIAIPRVPTPSEIAMPSVAQNISGSSGDLDDGVSREVAEIVRTAKEKGVEVAVNMVRREEPVIIDAAHDALVEDLKDENIE